MLEIENIHLYSNLISRLYQVANGIDISEPFILQDNSNLIDLYNSFAIISNPFNLETFNKPINTKLQKYLVENLSGAEQEKAIWNKLKELNDYFCDFLIDFDLEIDYNDNITLQDFIKALSPKVELVDYVNIKNTYLKILSIVSRLHSFKFIIFFRY